LGATSFSPKQRWEMREKLSHWSKIRVPTRQGVQIRGIDALAAAGKAGVLIAVNSSLSGSRLSSNERQKVWTTPSAEMLPMLRCSTPAALLYEPSTSPKSAAVRGNMKMGALEDYPWACHRHRRPPTFCAYIRPRIQMWRCPVGMCHSLCQ
jgi:hypothetical protein